MQHIVYKCKLYVEKTQLKFIIYIGQVEENLTFIFHESMRKE